MFKFQNKKINLFNNWQQLIKKINMKTYFMDLNKMRENDC